MPWTNGAFTVYHGCDEKSARDIKANGVDLNQCRPRTDFGVGFYTTTNRHQAENWANTRVRRMGRKGRHAVATLLTLEVDRTALSACRVMCFVTEGWKSGVPTVQSDYWQFILHCRYGGSNHQLRPGINSNYDVVFGPVSLYPQVLTVQNCDQISFHSTPALLATKVVSIISASSVTAGLFP